MADPIPPVQYDAAASSRIPSQVSAAEAAALARQAALDPANPIRSRLTAPATRDNPVRNAAPTDGETLFRAQVIAQAQERADAFAAVRQDDLKTRRFDDLAADTQARSAQATADAIEQTNVDDAIEAARQERLLTQQINDEAQQRRLDEVADAQARALDAQLESQRQTRRLEDEQRIATVERRAANREAAIASYRRAQSLAGTVTSDVNDRAIQFDEAPARRVRPVDLVA